MRAVGDQPGRPVQRGQLSELGGSIDISAGDPNQSRTGGQFSTWARRESTGLGGERKRNNSRIRSYLFFKEPNTRRLRSLLPNLSHKFDLSTCLRCDSIFHIADMEKDRDVIATVSNKAKPSIVVEFRHHPKRNGRHRRWVWSKLILSDDSRVDQISSSLASTHLCDLPYSFS